MELYRPVTQQEYEAIAALDFGGFPKQQADRPLLTLLLSCEGAKQIARHLHMPDGDGHVYVLGCMVDDAYIRQFPVQNIEDIQRRALWLAAEETEIFNQHLIGKIRVIEQYRPAPEERDVFFV